jgi:soluble lytic murein transglycosylase-like protein
MSSLVWPRCPAYAYRAETYAAAARHGLDGDLVLALALHESVGGWTIAYRLELQFWLKYLAGKPEWRDANPHRVAASYGLLQVMYPVALERGLPRDMDPEDLCKPVVGLEYGCRQFAYQLAWARGRTQDDTAAVDMALAAYNGGRGAARQAPFPNQPYIDKVRAELRAVHEGRVVFT